MEHRDPAGSEESIRDALTRFLVFVGGHFGNRLADVDTHLRYPRGFGGTLAGSSLGEAAWTAEPGEAVMKELLSDPAIERWFGAEPVAQGEVRGVVSSFAQAWARLGVGPEAFAEAHVSGLIDRLRNPIYEAIGYGVAYGVTMDERVDLPMSCALSPLVDDFLNTLRQAGELSEGDLIKTHHGWGCLFIVGSSASREHFGPFAATHAGVWALVQMRSLRFAIWLATGVLPLVGHFFARDLSEYPCQRIWHIPQQLQTYPTEAYKLTDDDVRCLRRILVQTDFSALEQSVPEETLNHLHLAWNEAALTADQGEPMVQVLLSFVILDGLLLTVEDPDSRLGPRTASLIGQDVDERRQIRRTVEALSRLRSSIAHGDVTDRRLIERVIGGAVSQEEFDVYFRWAGDAPRSALVERAHLLARRTFLAFINLAVPVSADLKGEAGLSRREVIQLLEDAAGGSLEARQTLDANLRQLGTLPRVT